MSKNITIQEGGTAKQMTVDKLKTNLVGGGTQLWVPEDEVTLGTKVITENGTYYASADGYYGYESVEVKGIGSISGTGSDGEQHYVHIDPETGEIKDTVLPSKIVITNLPTKTDYDSGEAIDYTGMVVTAFLSNDEAWEDAQHPGGVIPINELTLSVTNASLNTDNSDLLVEGELETQPASPIKYGSTIQFTYENNYRIDTYTYEGTGIRCMCAEHSDYRIGFVIASSQPATITAKDIRVVKRTGEETTVSDETITLYNTFEYGGLTVYYKYTGYITSDSNALFTVMSPPKEHLPSNVSLTTKEVAWTLVYGTQLGPTPGTQEIPVAWSRPFDGEVLETTFDVNVATGDPD